MKSNRVLPSGSGERWRGTAQEGLTEAKKDRVEKKADGVGV